MNWKKNLKRDVGTKNEGIDLYSDSLNRPPKKDGKHAVRRSEREREIEADCIEFQARENYRKKEIWTRTECECVFAVPIAKDPSNLWGELMCALWTERMPLSHLFWIRFFYFIFCLPHSLFPSRSRSHSHWHTRICSMPVRHSMVNAEYKYGDRDNHHICIALAMYSVLYYALHAIPNTKP